MSFLSDNKQLLIHVGCELVVIGGVAYYLNNKVNKQATEIEELKKMVDQQQKILNHLMTQVIPNLENTISRTQISFNEDRKGDRKKDRKEKKSKKKAKQEEKTFTTLLDEEVEKLD